MIKPDDMQARPAARPGPAPQDRTAARAGKAAQAKTPAAGRDGAMVSPWRGTAPELLTAAGAVIAVAMAGYAAAGWTGLTVVAVATAAIAMLVLRGLLPQLTPDTAKKGREKPRARTPTGYSQRRFVINNAMNSQNYYDVELRPVLEHLLAARLAERHGVHLYQDPDAARRLLCRNPRDTDLWRWIDPTTRPETSAREGSERRGIPRRTLARLTDRLERL
ncbi:MAG: hypothetical protein ACRDOH_30330 [Streptosporangiaceae bacterium]